MGIGARYRGTARFKRLAQRFECAALEFGQLIEKEDAGMGERNFARLRPQSSADQ